MLQPGDEFRLNRTLRVTGGNATDGHDWTEVYWSEEDGDYVEPDSPRSGVGTLWERNGGTASAGTVVEARFRATVDGEPTYEFDAATTACRVTTVTGVCPVIAGGVVTGVTVEYTVRVGCRVVDVYCVTNPTNCCAEAAECTACPAGLPASFPFTLSGAWGPTLTGLAAYSPTAGRWQANGGVAYSDRWTLDATFYCSGSAFFCVAVVTYYDTGTGAYYADTSNFSSPVAATVFSGTLDCDGPCYATYQLGAASANPYVAAGPLLTLGSCGTPTTSGSDAPAASCGTQEAVAASYAVDATGLIDGACADCDTFASATVARVGDACQWDQASGADVCGSLNVKWRLQYNGAGVWYLWLGGTETGGAADPTAGWAWYACLDSAFNGVGASTFGISGTTGANCSTYPATVTVTAVP